MKAAIPNSTIYTIEALSLLATVILCGLWAFGPERNYEPFAVFSGVILTAAEVYRQWAKSEPVVPLGKGGDGGNAKVGTGSAIGGKGGDSGAGGDGGAGGHGEVAGEGVAIGGAGGEAGQADRGGRGGASGAEQLGLANVQLPDGRWLWDVGRGGDGAPPSGKANARSPD